jgi:hypothetical protein
MISTNKLKQGLNKKKSATYFLGIDKKGNVIKKSIGQTNPFFHTTTLIQLSDCGFPLIKRFGYMIVLFVCIAGTMLHSLLHQDLYLF